MVSILSFHLDWQRRALTQEIPPFVYLSTFHFILSLLNLFSFFIFCLIRLALSHSICLFQCPSYAKYCSKQYQTSASSLLLFPCTSVMASKPTKDSTGEGGSSRPPSTDCTDVDSQVIVEDQNNEAAPARERSQAQPTQPYNQHEPLRSTHLSARVGSFSPRLLQPTMDGTGQIRTTIWVEEVRPESDVIFTPFIIARPAEDDPNLARRKHFIYLDSPSGRRRVPNLKSILRRHNISPRLPKPHQHPKSARFTNFASVYRGQTPMNESDIIWTALRPPGVVPDLDDDKMNEEPPVPGETKNDKNSASFHHLMMRGPTAASYSGTQPHPEQPKARSSSLLGEASPSTSETSEPSRFEMLAPRPPTPPLPSPPPAKAFRTFILPPDDVPVQGGSTPTQPPAPLTHPPDPPNIQQPSPTSSGGLFGGTVQTQASHSAPSNLQQPRLTSSGQTFGGNSQIQAPHPSSKTPGASASPSISDPPLRIGPTQHKGRGLFATRSLPTGTIIVRERPLIEERHDLLPGGQRRIRGS